MLRRAHSSPKLKRLKRKLQIPQYQAVGLLESLWHMTATQAPRGDLGRWSNEDIAAELEWAGDEDALIEALVNCGWLDPDPEHRLLVHDWAEHCDRSVKRSKVIQDRGFVAPTNSQGSKMAAQDTKMAASGSKMVSQGSRMARSRARGRARGRAEAGAGAGAGAGASAGDEESASVKSPPTSPPPPTPARERASRREEKESVLLTMWKTVHDGRPPPEIKARNPDAYRTTVLTKLWPPPGAPRLQMDQVRAAMLAFRKRRSVWSDAPTRAGVSEFVNAFEDWLDAGKRDAYAQRHRMDP